MMPKEPPPAGLFWYRGCLRPRRAGLVFNPRRLRCPDGHLVHVHGRVIAKGEVCGFRAHSGAPPCGAIVFLQLMPRPETSQATLERRRAEGQPLKQSWFYAVDLSDQELREIEEEALSPEEIVERFGGGFPDAGPTEQREGATRAHDSN